MIREYTKSDIMSILNVINDAAIKYKGIIPDDCWQEPYMNKQELINEFDNNVHMYGYSINNKLIGVMGLQKLKDVTLIRHAYILTKYQGGGIGKTLLEYLLQKNKNTCFLVGTWKDAIWAIHFYEKFNFVIQTKKQSVLLLNKYWNISSNQIKNSVVLKN